MSELYCLDTSFLINGWVKHYRKTVFPTLWEVIETSLADGKSFSCREVLEEVKRQDDDLADWAKARKQVFQDANKKIVADLTAVMQAFPNFAAQGGTRNAADPWVIAHAKHAGAIVVTDEKLDPKRRPTKPPTIPNACEALDVPYLAPIDYLERIGVEL